MKAKQVKNLIEAYASIYSTISEDHFKVGDEVVCKKSGMEGEVIKLDKPSGEDDEKYYTVKREDGKTMKYSADELKLAEEDEEKEDEEKEDEKKDVKEAKNGGAPKKSETKFHLKLDNLVHKTFGPSPEEKKMKTEEVETDLFDYLLEYLVAEGYADTNKAALAIMANMSEEWKQDIVEAKYGTKAGRKALAKKIRKGEEIGKSGPGTGFKAVEKAAKEGGARDPEAVAAAAMWKTHGGKKG